MFVHNLPRITSASSDKLERRISQWILRYLKKINDRQFVHPTNGLHYRTQTFSQTLHFPWRTDRGRVNCIDSTAFIFLWDFKKFNRQGLDCFSIFRHPGNGKRDRGVTLRTGLENLAKMTPKRSIFVNISTKWKRFDLRRFKQSLTENSLYEDSEREIFNNGMTVIAISVSLKLSSLMSCADQELNYRIYSQLQCR